MTGSSAKAVELTGAIVPLVTPFTASDCVDGAALRRVVNFISDEGADGLMLTALTGEGNLLSYEETMTVWDIVFECNGGGLPVIPTVLSTATAAAVKMAQRAETKGLAAVMAAPISPELYGRRADRHVSAFYGDVASAVSIPVIVFNYPSLTGVDFSPSLIATLAEIENVRYVKESTGDSRRIHAIQRLVGDRLSVICGAPNVALEGLALGCRAWITGIMNMIPRSAGLLIRAMESGNLQLARRIYSDHILRVFDLVEKTGNTIGTIKAGLLGRGVPVGIPRRPGLPLDEHDQAAVTRTVNEIARAEVAIQQKMSASG